MVPPYMKLFGFLLVMLLTSGFAAPIVLHMGMADWNFSALAQANEARTTWFTQQDYSIDAVFNTSHATLLTLHLNQLGVTFPPPPPESEFTWVRIHHHTPHNHVPQHSPLHQHSPHDHVPVAAEGEGSAAAEGEGSAQHQTPSQKHDISMFSLEGAATDPRGAVVKWELKKGTVHYRYPGRKRFQCEWQGSDPPHDSSLQAYIQSEVERCIGHSKRSDVGSLPCKRARTETDRFDVSAGWSDYERQREGSRHDRVRPPGESYTERGTARDEAQAEATILRDQLASLQSKICSLIHAASDSSLDADPMEHTAAVILHDALQEMLSSSGLPVPDTVPPVRPTVEVPVSQPSTTTAHWGGASFPLGELRILPSELVWVPLEKGGGNRVATVSLASIDSIDDEDDVSAILLLDLKDGDRIRLDFGSTGRALSALLEFESQLHAARDALPEARPPTETRRVREGRELRTGLQEVSKLKGLGHTKQAQAKLDSLSSGNAPTKGTVNARAFEMAGQLFKVGNLELTRAVLDKFLSLRDVKQALPEAILKTRQEMADAATATQILETAKSFFTVIMKVKGVTGKGRRSDVNMNAFWASAASLLPRNLLQTRHGRATARLLGIPYRVIKRASTIRADIEDSGVGWKYITTNGHSDCADGRLVSEFWHSELASTEDNQNKEPITVYDGAPTRTGAGY